MKLRVALNGRRADLEVSGEGGDCDFRYGDSFQGSASVVEVEAGVYSVLCNGRSYQVRVDLTRNRGQVELAGRVFPVVVEDPREIGEHVSAGPLAGKHQVIAPMPGRVVRVLVEEGQTIASGQGIVVVEAMKMQNEMQAPAAGRVEAVKVAAGEAVAAGQVLVVVDSGGEDGDG
jgi:biotin carboxyl carrier protein